ncbi:MAG: MFS transporter [Bdellovibrionota bacterium]
MKRLEKLYTGFQFFFGLYLWVPIFYSYQRQMGLSDTEIFGIQSLYYLAFCLLEIPTGYLADRLGPRLCLRLGGLGLIVSNLIPVFAPTYWGFLAHNLIIALARSLVSGASSAYLYESLKKEGREGEYKRIEGAANSYGLVGKVVGWAAVGYLMQLRFSLPYTLSAVSAGVALLFALALPRESWAIGGERRSFVADFSKMGGILRSSPLLVFVMLQGVALFVIGRLQIQLFQPILVSKGVPIAAMGWIMSLITVFEALGSRSPLALRRWVPDLSAIAVLTLVMAASLVGMGFGGAMGAVAGLSVLSLAFGLSFPLQKQLMNDAIPEARYRATLLSLESLLDRAVCAGVNLALGVYVASSRVDEFLYLSAALIVAMVAVQKGVRSLSDRRRVNLAR